jgi:hypothetical protein
MMTHQEKPKEEAARKTLASQLPTARMETKHKESVKCVKKVDA